MALERLRPDSFGKALYVPNLSHTIRRLDAFHRHFQDGVQLIAAEHGLSVRIDDARLTRTFLKWGHAFSSQLDASSRDKRDYLIFTAGLLLRHVIVEQPMTAKPVMPVLEDAADSEKRIIAFWPEGFLAFAYCFNVLNIVTQEKQVAGVSLTPHARDLRSWWSFRENARECPDLAVPFFDLFVGAEPVWGAPASAESRPALARDHEASQLAPSSSRSRWSAQHDPGDDRADASRLRPRDA